MPILSLSNLSRASFVVAIAIFVSGLLTAVVNAPCSDVAAYITLGGIATAGLGCTLLLVQAIAQRSSRPLVFCLVGVCGMGMAYGLAFVWPMSFCRGV